MNVYMMFPELESNAEAFPPLPTYDVVQSSEQERIIDIYPVMPGSNNKSSRKASIERWEKSKQTFSDRDI